MSKEDFKKFIEDYTGLDYEDLFALYLIGIALDIGTKAINTIRKLLNDKEKEN